MTLRSDDGDPKGSLGSCSNKRRRSSITSNPSGFRGLSDKSAQTPVMVLTIVIMLKLTSSTSVTNVMG